MVKRLAFILLFAPSLLQAGGTVLAGKGTGTVVAVKGAGNANMVIFNGYQPPGGFQVTTVSSNSITATWNAALTPDATGYRLHISTSPDFFNVTSIVTQSLTGTFTGLNVNQNYFLHVQSAYYGGIDSAWSITLSSATLSTIPVALSSTWTVTTTSVGALWDRGDNPANTTLYTIQLSTVSDLASGTVYSSSTYFVSSTFTALTSGTTYFARVQSVNLVGVPSSYLHLGSTRTLDVAAPTLVQSTCSASSSHNGIYVLTLAGVTAGNTIITGIADTGDALGTGVVTSVPATTFTQYPVNAVTNGSAGVSVYASTNVASGGSYTITANQGGGTAGMSMCIAEVTGVTSFDVSKTASTTGTNATSGAYTTSSNTFCYAILSHSSAGSPVLTPVGTQIAEDENNSTDQAYNAQYTTPAAGSNTSAWTNASIAYVVNAACFK